ncbi:MAG: hypothetical protein E7287_04695 [Lachnospiraceae bacterium]|nr:hypothetical protein [Lachnospiraceae bacterium]
MRKILKESHFEKFTWIMSFMIPVGIMLGIFVYRKIYPFGDRSFLFSDMYHQYMPFFSEFIDKIKAGEGLSYSYNVGIGSNFLALYVYYLASPLHWLAFLVPKAHLMEFMSYLAVVKVGLCGLTAFYYLRKHFGRKDFASLLFSVFYALSGFMAAYNWNIMWLDCVVLLPLIMLGLERLVKEGKCGMYCVTLALSIFTNYYISIMICIFLVLYFAVLLLSEKRSFKIVVNFALYSLLAGGMEAILLIPEVCAILKTSFGNSAFPEKVESYFSVLDMLARHSLAVTTHRGLDHWPNIYCGVAVFMLLPMYVTNVKVPMKRRFGMLGLAGIMLVSFSTNVLDFIWHGFNYPDSLPARQSFIYIFLLIVMSYEAFVTVKESETKQILYSYLAGVVFLLFCEKFVDSKDFMTGIFIVTILFVTAYAVILYLYRTREGKRWRFLISFAAFALVVTESTVNTLNTTIGTTGRSAYLNEIKDYQALYELTQEKEDGFYRVEKFTRKTKNDGTLAGYPTASVFSSTMNSQVKELYKRLGMRHSKVYYGYDGATSFTSALLNVDYMFGESDKYENYLYDFVEKSGDIYLYENLVTLPFGYVAPYGYDLPEGYANSPLRLQNEMIKGLGFTEALFREASCKDDGGDKVITAYEPGVYYAVLTNSSTKKLAVIGGALEEQKHKDLKNGGVVYLGYLEKGESVTLTNDDEEDDTPKVGAKAYIMNEQLLKKVIDKLSEQHMTNVEYDSTHVSGELSLKERGRLILSIPYEDGWAVTINGKEKEPALFGEALMAFDLEAGEYHFEMHYVPTGTWAGIIVSIVSVGIFALIMIGSRMLERRRKNTKK